MSYSLPFSLNNWIEDHREYLQPPVCNKQVFEQDDFIVKVVGGPNNHTDYHYNETPELFLQIEGEMNLAVVDEGEFNERGVDHLVLDIPSLDRLHDDGLLSCHHLFWQVIEGSHQASPNSLLHKTITEMAYVANEIDDGFYFINLQIPAFINDAAPSRPVLYAAQALS